MGYTWIKAYTEILDDPKMGRMSDHLWRRTIEIFLIAGRAGDNGKLPSVEEMAWQLRTTVTELSVDLSAMEEAGIIKKDDTSITVVNFSKRQAAMTESERQQRHRAGVTKPVTKRHETVTEEEGEGEEEEDKKKSGKDISVIIHAMENCGMFPNSTTPQLVGDWISEHSTEWILNAIERGKGKNQNYVDKILIGWKANGYPKSRQQQIDAARAPGDNQRSQSSQRLPAGV